MNSLSNDGFYEYLRIIGITKTTRHLYQYCFNFGRRQLPSNFATLSTAEIKTLIPSKYENQFIAALNHYKHFVEESAALAVLGLKQKEKSDRKPRRGREKFRERILKAYDHSCAITGCKIVRLLEAAHIVPYRASKGNKESHGILLRSDIHALFDVGLISINPKTWSVCCSQDILSDPYYKQLNGSRITLPINEDHKPDQMRVLHHFRFISGFSDVKF